tara:strand:- start:982 stop:1662 length:681 start_codon:yes stop_codon:yes gene_type:complete
LQREASGTDRAATTFFDDDSSRKPITRLVSGLRDGTGASLPLRVREDIARQQDRSEQIISIVQIVIVLLFGALFLAAPGPVDRDIAFELTPWALGGYLVFSVARYVASYRMRLPSWFLTLSVIADMALLMVLIWSFHRTYQQPPPFYLKAPTLLYVFIFIALRAPRFDARYAPLRRQSRRSTNGTGHWSRRASLPWTSTPRPHRAILSSPPSVTRAGSNTRSSATR